MSDESGFDDRRLHTRTPLVLKVEYGSRDGFLRDYTANISRGGTMLRTSRDLDEGTEVDLLLSFPGLLKEITLRGVVRWIQDEGQDEDRAVGVEFLGDDERNFRELARLVERIEAGDEGVVASFVMRVLVVEDNPHVAQLIQRGLDAQLQRSGGRIGFEVQHASDGLQALALLDESVHLLITDIFLPGLDGEQMIRKVRADGRFDNLPIIAVSAGGNEVRHRVLEAGADFFLAKPLRLADLLGSMRRLLAVGDRVPLPQ
ncbi:MAG: TIGR02266 family protein [Myxococcales bacterium]|nr:TIGR02266 family protein [Myxococcales bacterium]